MTESKQKQKCFLVKKSFESQKIPLKLYSLAATLIVTANFRVFLIKIKIFVENFRVINCVIQKGESTFTNKTVWKEKLTEKYTEK